MAGPTGAPILLGVNIDHVATIRAARGTRYPEPIQAALVSFHLLSRMEWDLSAT